MNSLYPNLKYNQNSNYQDKNNILFPARVKDILLSDDSKLFDNINGWGSLGFIKFQPLYNVLDNDNDSLFIAKPLFSNIKQFPLKEEIVLILNSPSPELNSNDNASEYYYFNLPINIWNNNHNNAIPDINKYNNELKDIKLGNTFKETNNIQNLLPEEGDVIIEGRFGNSIRFSSSTPNKLTNQNSWSSQGENGDPIIIIRNKQNIQTENPWNPVQENINEDGSSIYLCSNQEIPINLGCTNLKSLSITLSNSFNPSSQIFKNSF